MKLTYLFHSGFLLEADGFAVVFDYYRGGEAILDEVLRRGEPLYVLVSHEHRDHYTPEILNWSRLNSRICYLFPREMNSRSELVHLPNAAFLSRGESFADERVRVTAFGSTDLGASFEVETGGRVIFHAGDLNNWHWTDESTEEEVREAEAAYRAELDYLGQTVARFDVAMFPVDARLGSDYMRGARGRAFRAHALLSRSLQGRSLCPHSPAARGRFCAVEPYGRQCDYSITIL